MGKCSPPLANAIFDKVSTEFPYNTRLAALYRDDCTHKGKLVPITATMDNSLERDVQE